MGEGGHNAAHAARGALCRAALLHRAESLLGAFGAALAVSCATALVLLPGGSGGDTVPAAGLALAGGLALGRWRARRESGPMLPPSLLASLPDGVALLDGEDRITWASDRFLALAGYDRTELMGVPFLRLFRGDSLEAVRTHRPARCHGAVGPSLDVLVTRRNGADLPVQLVFSPLAGGGVCVVMAEQTVRRAAEAALERSEARFRTVFENASMGMAYLEEGRVAAANPALGAMLGQKPAAMVGHDLLAMIGGRSDPEDAAPPGGDGDGAVTPPEADEYQVSLPDAAAEWVRVSWSGEGSRAVALVEDISDAKAIEAQLKHMDRLSQLGELAASLAHEIGQPLNVIRLTAEGALDRLQSGRLDLARQTRGLTVVLEQADRLQQIIDHTLSYSRRGNEQASLIDPRPVIDAAVAFVGRRFSGHGLRFTWQPPRRIARVFAHPVRLEQVITNLLTNAGDAILGDRGAGGGIEVSCRFDEENGQVVLSVSDDGPGIPPAVQARLFEPFFTTKSHGKGTGLGLAVSLGIVAEMGGSIEVSNLFPGARFAVLLPAQEVVEDLPPLYGPLVQGERPHVLVADDEPLAVAEIAAFLGGRGYRVTTAGGGNAALSAFLADPADVVVTDLNMTDGDGITLIRRLKDEDPGVPVIAFTVLAGEVPGQALEAGASLVLPKPLGLMQIDARIQALLAETCPPDGKRPARRKEESSGRV